MQPDPNTHLEKIELRKTLRKIDISNQQQRSEKLCAKLGDFLSTCGENLIVAAFIALPGEVDLRSLFPQAPVSFVLPRIEGNSLIFHDFSNDVSTLETGSFGILEPSIKSPVVNMSHISLFLTPGLGFDRDGGRIGRGKGFYDRAFTRANSEAERVGICFEEQIIDRVPIDRFDRQMHRIFSA